MSKIVANQISPRSGGTVTVNGAISGTNGTFTGDVSIGGTLTYDDVTNIDSVGLITARSGLEVGVSGAGGTITAAGDATFVGIITASSFSGSGANLTNIPSAQLTGALPAIDGSALTGIAGTSDVRTATLGVSGISTFSGDVDFTKMLQEKINIVASNVSSSPNIDLENGMFHYFSTNETTTGTPNFRYNGSTTLMSKMDIGETLTVTLMTRPNNAGYNPSLNIDGQSVNLSWLGGAAPTSANSGGMDLYTYQIIKYANTGTISNDTHILSHIVNFN